MTPSLAFHLDIGDQVEIGSRPYYFDGVQPDGAVYFRSPQGTSYPDLLIEDENGHPRRPTVSEINKLFAEDVLILRSKPSSIAARRMAREMQLNAQQCREMDSKSIFRIRMAAYCDEHCKSLSDEAMLPVIAKALKEPQIAKENTGNWDPHPSTVREWMRSRGQPHRRKPRDGVAMTGRCKDPFKVRGPVEPFVHNLLQACLANDRRQVQAHYDRYVAEIATINRGLPLNRKRLVRDNDGCWQPSNEDAVFRRPDQPHKPVSYSTFWRKTRDESSRHLLGLAITPQAAEARYGGGGFTERPPFGSLCELDETPVPTLFLVDDNTHIPMGTATATYMVEACTKALVGWDICPEAASSASLLRTICHANSIKDVPEDLLQKFPDLPYVRLKPDRITVDNSPGAHSSHVEDACAEAYISIRWTGKAKPKDKVHVERVIGTQLEMLFKKLPQHNYDIALMRKFGFNPDVQVLCPFSKARELLDRACFTYNISRHA